MIGVSTSPFYLFLLRKTNVWYSCKDGNWSDPNTWLSNALDRKIVLTPQVGDTVYVNHVVTMDVATIHIKNIYISGTLLATASPAVSITIDGDCQVSGSGLISLPFQFHNLILNGYNNIISAAGFNAGSFSTVTYNAILDQPILNIPYNNLATQNTGKKYQIDNVTVGGTFNQQSNYECGNYNLTVNGTSAIGTVGAFTFSKNGPGNILFVGNVEFQGATDLSAGNPNVEFRGGFDIHTFSFISGTGNVTFSTNSQTLSCSAFLGGVWNAPIIVQGAITVTLTGGTFTANSTINGTVSDSTFDNNGILYLAYNSTPMSTGVFNYQNTTSSTLGYVFNGAATLPYSSYANLVIAGTGIKSLGANASIAQSLTISSGIMDCAGYNLSVSTTFTCSGDFRATSFSSLLFVGFVQINTGLSSGFDLRTGNPNVEFRGGFDVHASQCYTGTGTFTFTTNNQAMGFSAFNGGLCSANFLVSGAITVTFSGGAVVPNSTGTLNGDNANSVFVMGSGSFDYCNATAPMVTGKIYCNQAANTFIYGLTGGQDITPPSDPTPGYKNLTLNGSGAKRLLGNVSVKGIYTLTSAATLNSNGFALTNP